MRRILFLLFLIINSLSVSADNEIDSLLSVLDNTIRNRQSYVTAKESKINNLKQMLDVPDISLEQSYLINSKLYDEYRSYVFDSALYYISIKKDLAEKLGKNERLIESKLQQVNLLSSTGMYNEAIDLIHSINRSTLSQSMIIEYYSSCELLYNQLFHYARVKENIPVYKKLSNQYVDSLLIVLSPTSDKYLKYKEKRLLELGKIEGSRELIFKLIATSNEGSPEYAFYNYRMSLTYEAENNNELRKKFLIKSAISDLQSAVKDNASLALLANILYHEKKIDKAYEYIQVAMDDANKFNAPLRFIELSYILPLINESYQLKSEEQKNKLRFYLVMISVLSIFLITAILLIYNQIKNLKRIRNDLQTANTQLSDLNSDLNSVNSKLNDLNLELSESNHIKEQYIGHFLNRCSNYIDKLENYQRFVNKQITAHKINELIESTKSKQLIDQELKEFYDNFDDTFLHLYPDFVEEMNSLLQNDERIVLKKGELLNTELRIFALIKLGITDSSKIASLLRYSVNTIYNYRVKIKNKASVPRDDFEEQVMRIGSLSKHYKL